MFSGTDAKIKKLMKILSDIIELLEWDDEVRWREVIIEVQQDLDASKISTSIDLLLSIYGGMGSFNDIVLGKVIKNGKFIRWKSKTKEKNKKFNALRLKAYDLAEEIVESPG